MLEKEKPSLTINKESENTIEEMKYNSEGKLITEITPVYEVYLEKIGATIETRVDRVDGDQNKHSDMNKRNNKQKDVLGNIGLYDLEQEFLNRPYVPHPQMAESMKKWEEEFDNDINEASMINNEKKFNINKIDTRRANYKKRTGILISSVDSTQNQSTDRTRMSLPNLASFKNNKDNLSVKWSIQENIKNKHSNGLKTDRNNSITNFDPLSVLTKSALKRHKASIDWQDYAQMRMPFLPEIFKAIETTDNILKSNLNHRQ